MASVNPKVFVIDDDPAVRQSVCWLVESTGRQVEQHESAESFLGKYLPDQPGCVLTDVRMPGLSGLQLQETLAQRGCAIPVIIMTAYGDVPTAVRAIKAGAVDFLEKPYSDQALLGLIEEAIQEDERLRQQRRKKDATRERVESLTPRERQIMELVVLGRSNKDMAAELKISTKTVEAHRSKVMGKMAAGSVAELTTMAAAVS